MKDSCAMREKSLVRIVGKSKPGTEVVLVGTDWNHRIDWTIGIAEADRRIGKGVLGIGIVVVPYTEIDRQLRQQLDIVLENAASFQRCGSTRVGPKALVAEPDVPRRL